MRGHIRQWFTDSPRAMNAAYALLMGSWVFFELGLHDASGATAGP